MEFDWSLPSDALKLPADNLDRSKYATYLTSLIKVKAGDKYNLSNYVLNLDADWGAGKTYFLKRWSEDLKGHHPVVYIDAWSIDYLDSPLMTVLSEIIEQLKAQTSRADTPEAKGKIKEIFKAAAPRVGSALMKRYLGFDLNIFESENVSDDKPSKEIDFSKAGEKVLEIFCKEITESKKSVEVLKKAIKEWVHYVIDKPLDNDNDQCDYPAFIFIDELDRCKPTYAVEMLEAIKHVFDIPGLVFIVATNSAQLAHTVRAVYGSDFNAEIYLSRFFNSKYYLRAKVSKELLSSYHNGAPFDSEYLINKSCILFPFIEFDKSSFFKLSADLFNALNLPPRQAIKILHRIELVVSSFKNNSTLYLPLLLCLCSLMEVGQQQLNKFIHSLNHNSYSNEPIFNTLKQVFFEINIDIYRGRRLYAQIRDELMEYEDLSRTVVGGDTRVRVKVSLFDYIAIYKRNTTLADYNGPKAHGDISSLIHQTQFGRKLNAHELNEIRKRLNTMKIHHLFYVFQNTANFNTYHELVEISSDLD